MNQNVMTSIKRQVTTTTVTGGCKRPGIAEGELSLAMSYTPVQTLKNTYGAMQALRTGTLFPELDKPFLAENGGDCRERE